MNQTDIPISVIGAGVMGLGAAAALAEQHTNITLYDPAPLCTRQNASLLAGGMLAPYSEIEHMPESHLAAAMVGFSFWQETAPDSFTRNGTLIVAHEQDEYLFTRLTGKLKNFSVARQLYADDIAQIEPNLTRFAQGLYIKGEAHLDPTGALKILEKKIPDIRHGNFDLDNASDDGWIIDCRGHEAAVHDQDLRGVKGESLLVRNPAFSLQRPVRLLHPRYPLYIVPRGDNVFMIGATVIESTGNTAVGVRSAMELLSAAYSLHPGFGDAEILEIRAGFRPAYPDNLPRITVEKNIIRCNGLFRHGFLFAPVMARCVADYIAGRNNEFTHLFLKEPHDRKTERTENQNRRRA